MEFIKKKFSKKTLAIVLGLGICFILPPAAHANQSSYQGTEVRAYDGFSSLPAAGIDLTREFFIRLDWIGSLGRAEKEHINLYYTPVTYANKTGYVFKAGKLYAMTSAYRFGYTDSANHVLDLGSAQAILGGYLDLTDEQLEQIQALIVNQTVESGFEITDNFTAIDTSDTEGDVFISGNDQDEKTNLLANVDSFINSSESVVREVAISSDSFINSIEAIEPDLPVEDNALTDDKSHIKVKGSKRMSADVDNDSGEPIKKPTMRERIAKILQESCYSEFNDNDMEKESTITEDQGNDNAENISGWEEADSSVSVEDVVVEEKDAVSDIIEEARRVREQLALLIK